MRLRTKLFLTWAGMMPLLWAPAFWSIQRTVQARYDRMARESFDGTKQGLEGMQRERIARMRQAGRMMMSIPELRALIAEQNYELSSENLGSLQERLDYLEDLVGASFVSVLNRDRRCIAQSRSAPWEKLQSANAFYSTSVQPVALIQQVFSRRERTDRAEYGLWSCAGRIYQVVAIPLIFQQDNETADGVAEGALILGVAISDESATELGKSHNCQVTFFSNGEIVASSLPQDGRKDLLSFYRARSGIDSSAFVFQLKNVTYHGSIEQLQDPCSGTAVGGMLIHCDLQDGRIKAQLLRSLLLIMIAGLAAGAVASFLISGAVTRPVQQLADGVRRVADGDLDLALPIKSRDELGELSGSFNEMVTQLRSRRDLKRQVEEAQASNRAKSQFLANMSHEIRTPLNGVIGMTELLLGTQLSEQQRRYAALVKTSGELLTTLINDILDFSKIEAGKLEIECIDFDLHATVEEVIDLLSERAGRKKLELGCFFQQDVPKLVRGDPDRLRQILVNLVNNAIKFTESGSVTLKVAAQSKSADHVAVRFSVIDTGIGISQDRIDRLFKPFSQVDASTTRKYGGTGLGLAISKQLAELMGGEIGVQSVANQGSTFWFTINLKRQAVQPAALRPVIDAQGFRVLAVDDSQTTRAILEQQLTSWDLQAETAGSAAEAIGALRHAADRGQAFKVAIIDSDMPGTSGFELARAIKGDAKLSHTVLMVMLSMETLVDRPKLKDAGFAGHVTKPLRQSQLFDSIMRAVAREHAGQSLEAPMPPSDQPKIPSGARGRILIAEDNEVNQIVAVELLNKAGYQCEVLDNGRKTFAAALTGKYDLILMDCQMPEMDGFEATRLIRQTEKTNGTRRIPIIALTANAIKGDREECLAAGMDGYSSKPIDPRQLLSSIETLLSITPVANTHAEAPSEVPPSLSPPIIVDALIERCMSSLTTITIVLGKFERQTHRDIEQIQQGISNRDATAVARTAHALKGAAAIVAASRITRIAAELERLGREQQLESMEHQLAELREATRECLDYLPQVQALASEKLASAVPHVQEERS